MGKKRLFNDQHKPPDHAQIHHHHRHQKPKKIKPESKLLHTLNSHLKKLAKFRSRNLVSLSTPPPPPDTDLKHHDHLSSWSKHDPYDWFADIEFRDDGGDGGAFDFGREVFLESGSYLGSESHEDVFGGDFVFAPDLNAGHNVVMVMMFGECGLAYGTYGSYIPDPVMRLDDDIEGNHVYDVLELSSQEDMIDEFLKVNLFVS